MLKKIRSICDYEFLLALGFVVGTTIGAGVFSLPFMAAKSGFFPYLVLLISVAILLSISNLMYGEITLRTKKEARLIGYAEKYLGGWGRSVAAISTFLSFYASLLVYMILGGMFLHNIFFSVLGGDVFWYSMALFSFVAIAIYFDLHIFSAIELWMTGVLLLVVLVIIFKCGFYIDVQNLYTIHWGGIFLPLGTVLFSLSSMSSISELEHILGKHKSRLKDVIITAMILCVMVYALFVLAILGVSGAFTSEEAFAGLGNFMSSSNVAIWGAFFGFLAVITSYLTTGFSLRQVFIYDYKYSKQKAWLLTCIIPLGLFLGGLRNFVSIVAFAGGVTSGICGILVALMFYKAKKEGDVNPEFSFNFPKILSSVIILIYLWGMIYQIFTLNDY